MTRALQRVSSSQSYLLSITGCAADDDDDADDDHRGVVRLCGLGLLC